MRRPTTMRARATTAAAVVTAIGLVVAAIAMLVALRKTLEHNVENAARVRALDVAALVRELDVPTILPVPVGKEAVVQVVDQDGRVLAASASVQATGPISSLRPEPGRSQTFTSSLLPIRDEEGDRFRVLALGVAGTSGPLTVFVALSLEQVNEAVALVRTFLLIGIPGLVALTGITTWLLVGRALRPVDAILEEVDDISERGLDRRVAEPNTDDEIGRLALGMNAMLGRLQRSSERQKKFVADASHELQSPIAAAITELEIALAHPSETDWDLTARALLVDQRRMSRLVKDLLVLAREDDSDAPHAFGPVDFDDIVRSEVARVRRRTEVEVDVSGVEPTELRAEAEALARLVRNLLDNAVRYADSRVVVELTHHDTFCRLSVIDDGVGIEPEAANRVFERFTRLDDARGRVTGGTGLGLSIVAEIAARHRGTVHVGPSNSGACIIVDLPMIAA